MFHLFLDDVALTIIPSHPEIEKSLTYVERTMELDERQPWKGTKVRQRNAKAFEDEPKEETVERIIKFFGEANISRREIGRGIETHQGAWRIVTDKIREMGMPYKLHDIRLPFPKPRLDLIHGLRFSQEPLLKQFLSQNMSGILEAPTRFGKSYLIGNTLRAYSRLPTVVTVPGSDLVEQLYDDLRAMLVGRNVKVIGSGIKGSAKFSGDDVTVCSMDSLYKCDVGKIELLVIDEIQSAVTDDRLADIVKFHKARRLGFSATTGGRFDGRDILIEALIGPTLARRTFREAVDEGAICDIVVIMIRVNIPPTGRFSQRHKMYAHVLHENPHIGEIVRWLTTQIIPPDWQTIGFIKTEASAEFFKSFVPGSEIAMAKLFPNKEARREMMRRMASGELKRCLASDIYSQGVTFSDLRCMINLAGGGPYFGSVQKPGRLAQVRPGKKAGIMFDFYLTTNNQWDPRAAGEHLFSILNQSAKRLEVYQSRGYKIIHVETPRQLKEALTPFM